MLLNIKKNANELAKKYDTRNPFDIINSLNVIILHVPLVGIRGFYQYFQRNNIIYLNEELSEHEARFVLAHELGHMFLHKDTNTIFMDTSTHFNTDRYEIEANAFAMDLLISDDALMEYHEFSLEQISRALGYDKELLKLRLQQNSHIGG
ncbi:MAG: ImmA/IrrE family metallo-endopeptidase [Anaerostipes sp.]|nr:ImmA/IrrE family metallo-endopeptidase [Anaerostipes sp.]